MEVLQSMDNSVEQEGFYCLPNSIYEMRVKLNTAKNRFLNNRNAKGKVR